MDYRSSMRKSWCFNKKLDKLYVWHDEFEIRSQKLCGNWIYHAWNMYKNTLNGPEIFSSYHVIEHIEVN